MINEEKKKRLNIINDRINIFDDNHSNSDNKNFEQDLMFSHNNNINNNKIFSTNYRTISYKKTDNFKKRLKNKLEEKNKNYLLDDSNIESKDTFSQNKFIQTLPNFYTIDNTNNTKKRNNKYFTTSIKKLNIIKNRYENNLRLLSGIKQNHISKNFIENFKKSNNSVNKLYPLINNQKTSSIKSYFHNVNIINSHRNNKSKENKKMHHNLLTIENIYFQKRIKNNSNFNTLVNTSSTEKNNKNLKLSLFKKKYAINEIKFPLYNDIIKKYKIINEKNDYLLEDIFKKQTLSNFNNKYTLKYKTKNKIKKENILNLFSLLKKYKNSDKDKETAFINYKSSKNQKKVFYI